MSEISLYRKYRPQTFGHLVGQDHVRVTLMNAVRTDKLSHAYLFTGPRGTGKTSTARLFAKAINCEDRSETGEPCEKCDICVDITSGRLIDVVEIDAASHTGVDDVRELIDKLHFAPTRAKNKVYIVDEVHMLSKGAFNAFLKTLEEPPTNVYFVLATTEAHKVPETIISRCQRFDFKRIDTKTVMARLAYIAQSENITVEEEALEMIARHVDGGLRDAIGLFEQLIVDGKLMAAHVRTILGVAGSSAVEKFYGLLMSKDSVETLRFIQELYGEGVDFGQFTKELLEKMRLEMLVRAHDRVLPEGL
ncbi:MAG: DNA polymerase III subunit gamma/tau [Candidatus Peregrinibacteria bacterium]|nr:DNA polymerase III subunit gamma/tau [Candidatus Peregrinibacteria bacterium]